MKTLVTITAVIAAAFTLNALPAAAQNADPATPPTDQTEQVVPEKDQVVPDKGLRPHSHVEWKTGAAPAAPSAPAAKPNPWTDYTKHFHPRDGK